MKDVAVFKSNYNALLAANLTWLQDGLSQQTLDSIASLAWQLSSSPALGEALQEFHKAGLVFTCPYTVSER